jgi:hypothetical protein
VPFSSLISLVYGLLVGWGGYREARRTGNRAIGALGGGLGGLALVGAILRWSGDPAGRGISLVAGTLGLLISGWTISRRILDRKPLGPAATLALLSLALVAAAARAELPASAPSGEAPIEGIEEASGVVRRGDRLLVVGDHEPGTYYSCPVPAGAGPTLALRPDRLRRHRIAGGPYALDLESIDLLADGRLVLLSERLGALLGEREIVGTYDLSLGEIGGRGLEGLAVRDLGNGRSRVAVLWEGGYPEADRLPGPVRDGLCESAFSPVVFVHDVDPGDVDREFLAGRDGREIALAVSRPPGPEPWAQRWRAPDLVWYRGERDGREAWGFLVLLSSGWSRRPGADHRECECPLESRGAPRKYCWKILQRFDLEGRPWGEPFDLESSFPENLRTVNWEGLGWYEPGESLVLVYDERVERRRVDPQVAVVVPLPDGW